MDEDARRQRVRRMFNRIAPRYVESIEPAFRPLAERLVKFAAPRPHEHLLDLGTGSGLAAFAAASQAAHVVGLDFSRELLEQARAAQKAGRGAANVTFVQGDMHALCFAEATFDVATGAFSFNSTDPLRAFAEAFRVLVPGGRLAIQEWGEPDELDEIVSDTLAEYAVEDPPPSLAALRQATAAPGPWDELDGIEGLTQTLKAAGFQEIAVYEDRLPVRFADIDSFLNYKLVWPNRHEELEAMPGRWRELFFSELRDRLEPRCDAGGGLTWQSGLVRLRALKPER